MNPFHKEEVVCLFLIIKTTLVVLIIIAFRCAAKNRNDVMFAKHNGNDVRTNINKDGHDKQ